MPLKETRIQFVNQSGRLDLINHDQTDNGADFYINAAQRWLDRQIENKAEMAKVYRKTTAGSHILKLQDSRAIHFVGVGDSESFTWLNKYDPYSLREKYSQPYSNVDQGRPKFFAPIYLRGSHSDSGDYDGLSVYMNTDSSWKTYNGILLMPIPDGEYHVEIWGKFYSEKLISDDDESFWTEMHDYILVMAAQRALEVFYRNTQGVQDWTQAIISELRGIEQDYIEEGLIDIDQIEG